MIRATDGWRPEELAESLKSEKLPRLTSVFERSLSQHHRRPDLANGPTVDGALAGIIATALSRAGERGDSHCRKGEVSPSDHGGKR